MNAECAPVLGAVPCRLDRIACFGCSVVGIFRVLESHLVYRRCLGVGDIWACLGRYMGDLWWACLALISRTKTYEVVGTVVKFLGCAMSVHVWGRGGAVQFGQPE